MQLYFHGEIICMLTIYSIAIPGEIFQDAVQDGICWRYAENTTKLLRWLHARFLIFSHLWGIWYSSHLRLCQVLDMDSCARSAVTSLVSISLAHAFSWYTKAADTTAYEGLFWWDGTIHPFVTSSGMDYHYTEAQDFGPDQSVYKGSLVEET